MLEIYFYWKMPPGDGKETRAPAGAQSLAIGQGCPQEPREGQGCPQEPTEGQGCPQEPRVGTGVPTAAPREGLGVPTEAGSRESGAHSSRE